MYVIICGNAGDIRDSILDDLIFNGAKYQYLSTYDSVTSSILLAKRWKTVSGASRYLNRFISTTKYTHSYFSHYSLKVHKLLNDEVDSLINHKRRKLDDRYNRGIRKLEELRNRMLD